MYLIFTEKPKALFGQPNTLLNWEWQNKNKQTRKHMLRNEVQTLERG